MVICSTLSCMSRSYPLRCAFTALLLLISTHFVLTTTIIDIPFTDERVLVNPKTDWYVQNFCEYRRNENPSDSRSYWSYNGTVACPGIWTGAPDEKHAISLNFTGYFVRRLWSKTVGWFRGTNDRVGITVYGYADPRLAPWKFEIDSEPAEILSLQPNTDCKVIKDRQGLKNGKHRVTLTPLERSFVLTKFRYAFSTRIQRQLLNVCPISVTQDDDPVLSPGQIAGIVVGGISILLAIPGIYFGYKAWSLTRRNEMKVWICMSWYSSNAASGLAEVVLLRLSYDILMNLMYEICAKCLEL
jgi:hypothetical protein